MDRSIFEISYRSFFYDLVRGFNLNFTLLAETEKSFYVPPSPPDLKLSHCHFRSIIAATTSCGDGLGHNAFKESVNSRALDPEHELSEVNDTFINILEKNSDHNNNDFIEGITLYHYS